MKKILNTRPWRIISGGQTGVDRAALVAAMSFSIPFGGWVPKGRLAEDGVVPEGFYGMQESEGGYRERTRANVRSGDATLILSDQFPLSVGTAYTAEIAAKLGKPCQVVDLNADTAAEQIRDWMLSLEKIIPNENDASKACPAIVTLNVAGPRESVSPGIFAKAKKVLLEVFAAFRNWSGGDLYSIDDDGSLIAWMSEEFSAELEGECLGHGEEIQDNDND